MKVVFVTRMLATYRAPIYERCFEQGHDVCVVHFVNHAYEKVKPPSEKRFRTRAYRNWLPTCMERRGWFFSPLLPWGAAGEHGARYVLEGESNLPVNLQLIPLLRLRGVPYVWWSLGTLPGGSLSLPRRLLQPLVRWLVRGAEAVASYSSFGKHYYAAMGLPEARLRIASNALSRETVYRELSENRVRAEALIRERGWEERLRVTYIGALSDAKRPGLLVAAAARFQQATGRRIGLFFVGEGPLLERCREQAMQLGVDAHFAGRQDLWAACYILAGHVVALPGLGGLAINHAMMLGRPVVCGPADGTEQDLIVDGQTGLLLAATTEQQLADAFAKLDADRPGLAALGERARAHVDRVASLDGLVGALIGTRMPDCNEGPARGAVREG